MSKQQFCTILIGVVYVSNPNRSKTNYEKNSGTQVLEKSQFFGNNHSFAHSSMSQRYLAIQSMTSGNFERTIEIEQVPLISIYSIVYSIPNRFPVLFNFLLHNYLLTKFCAVFRHSYVMLIHFGILYVVQQNHAMNKSNFRQYKYVNYTQSPIIRTGRIRTAAESLGKFKKLAVGSSNLRTKSKNLRTATAQIFKAKNRVLFSFLISFTCTYLHKFEFFFISQFL